MRYKGRIKTWKADKAFGFITPNDGGKDVFVHATSLVHGKRRPVGNETVTYEVTTDSKGRRRSSAVLFVGESMPRPAAAHSAGVRLMLAGLFLAMAAVLALLGKIPILLAGLYCFGSALAFLMYALDKSAAKLNRWRTSEEALLLVGLVGGWPGALIAQQLLHHKTSKKSFLAAFWGTVVLNCIGAGWLLSSAGSRFIARLSGAA
jgi:uncharacterized membrane protein YsdA (DUF1294 family)/cold shock CspA family protein